MKVKDISNQDEKIYAVSCLGFSGGSEWEQILFLLIFNFKKYLFDIIVYIIFLFDTIFY